MNKPTAGEKQAFWLSSSGRATFLSLTVGVFGAAWILLHSPRAVQVLAPSAMPSVGRANDLLSAEFSGRSKWARLDSEQLRHPLYLANLACRTGDYIVSVRRVNSDRYSFDNNLPYGSIPSGSSESERLRVVLQVMSTRTGRMQRIDHINTELTAVDSTGQRLKTLEDGEQFTFLDGIGCIYRVSAPSKTAGYLRSIEGIIHLIPDGAPSMVALPDAEGSAPAESPTPRKIGRSLPFRIENVPLPWKLRVFGLTGAAILDGSAARQAYPASLTLNKDTPVWVQGEPMEAILQLMPQTAFQTALRPPQSNLLALMPDVPNTMTLFLPAPEMPAWKSKPGMAALRFNSSVPALPFTCVLTPQVQSNGRMRVAVRMEGQHGAFLQTSVTVWDNEPALLMVPASRLYADPPQYGVLVLYLDLHLDNYPPESMFNSEIPQDWRAKQGEVGGALSGKIVTSKGAFGLGKASLTMQRWSADGTQASQPVTIDVALDKHGHFDLTNLAAGRYQIEPGKIEPYQSPAVVQSSFKAFLAQRFGIQNAKINVRRQEAVVKAKDRVELKPWVYGEGK